MKKLLKGIVIIAVVMISFGFGVKYGFEYEAAQTDWSNYHLELSFRDGIQSKYDGPDAIDIATGIIEDAVDSITELFD